MPASARVFHARREKYSAMSDEDYHAMLARMTNV